MERSKERAIDELTHYSSLIQACLRKDTSPRRIESTITNNKSSAFITDFQNTGIVHVYLSDGLITMFWSVVIYKVKHHYLLMLHCRWSHEGNTEGRSIPNFVAACSGTRQERVGEALEKKSCAVVRAACLRPGRSLVTSTSLEHALQLHLRAFPDGN